MQKLHYRPASEGSGRSPKICNSSVDESVYIKMIRQERPLWDKKHRDYKNLEVKNKIWKEIAEKCGSTDLECKRRWTGLREKYRREKILNYKQRRLGQVVDLTQRWRNYMNMMFLDQVYTPRGNYQKSNGSTSVEERDESIPAQEIKFEDDESDDDCNAADFLETSLNSNNALSLPESSPANFATASSSQLAQLTAQNINGNGSIFSNVSTDRLANQDSFPRIWVNSLPNLPMLSSHLKGDESSSSSQSDQKGHQTQPELNTNHHDLFAVNKTVNKYSSFGQYIADTLQEMEEKYANELHVHILEEIIKIKSKIFKES